MSWVDEIIARIDGSTGSFDAGGPHVLVPGVLEITDATVTVLSAQPPLAELRAVADLGGVSLTVLLLLPSSDFSIVKTDDAATWDLGALVAALGLDGAGLDGVVVSEMVLAGSMRTGAFRAVAGVADGSDWSPATVSSAGLALTGVTLEVGTIGGTGGAFAALSATGHIGAMAARVGGSCSPADPATGRRSWAVEAELVDLDLAALFGALGWNASAPGTLGVSSIAFRHDSAGPATSIVAEFAIGAPLGLGDLLESFGEAVGATLHAPEFLDRVTLGEVVVEFRRDGGDVVLDARCTGRLGFQLADPAAVVDDIDTTPLIALDVSVGRTPEGKVARFSGSLTVGGDDPVDLDLVLDQSATGATVVASYRAAVDPRIGSGRPIDLSMLAGGLALPQLEVVVEQVLFAWRRSAGVTVCLLAVGVASDGALAVEAPIVGSLFPAPGLSIGCVVTAASGRFARDDVAAVNALLAEGSRGGTPIEPLPAGGVPAGFNVVGRFDVGGEQLALGTGDDHADGGGGAPAAGAPTPTQTPQGSADGGGTKWVAVQRSFGPVHVARIGVAYTEPDLTMRLDATVSLAGLELSMLGLGFSTPLTEFRPTLELDGIGVSYASPAVAISGSFLRSGDQFLGSATIQTKAFSIVALGGLGEVDGEVSVFVFAALNRVFGGPAAFYVTGLALGFGYNRDFVAPAIEAVGDHPFLLALTDSTGSAPDAAAMLSRLDGSVPMRAGASWIAAGIRFESFSMIRSKAIVLVRFGGELEILLLGMSELTLPRGLPTRPYVRVELALKVSVKPDHGSALAEAMLTDRSFVIDPRCRITGRFAFALWFGNHPNSGDFVLSIGGYHPRFRRPAHYPDVPRLGISWQNGPITIKGEGYFSLTPSSVMAGGQLEATYRDGAIVASFVLRAHFLISWNPFAYDIQIGITVRAELVTDTLFGPVRIGGTVGADVHVWGPEFAGTATVRLGVSSFDVEFGAINAAPAGARQLPWNEFTTAFLPAGDAAGRFAVCEIQIVAGLDAQISVPIDGGERVDWVVRADQLSLSTRTVIPATMIELVGREGAVTRLARFAGDAKLGLQPMGTGAMTSAHSVGISKVIRRVGAGTVSTTYESVDLAGGWSHAGPIRQSVPKQLWNDVAYVAGPSADVLPNRIVGIAGLRPRRRVDADDPRAVDLAVFGSHEVVPARPLPLGAGPARSAAPGPTLASGETVFSLIRDDEQGGSAARSLRDAVVDLVRSRGFLPDDVGVPIQLPGLAASAGTILATAPMVAARVAVPAGVLPIHVLGRPTTAPALDAPIDPMPAVDLSVPPEMFAMVVRLLAEVEAHPYVEADGISAEHVAATVAAPSEGRALVIAGDQPAEATASPPLQRTLSSGRGIVLDVDVRGTDSYDEARMRQLELPARLVIAGDDLDARVVALDRFGRLVPAAVDHGSVELDPATATVVVIAATPRPAASDRVSGWHATSSMLRVAQRTFLIDGGLVEVQVDPGDEIAAMRGGAVIRSNTARRAPGGQEPEGARPGWVRTMLPNDVRTLAVLVRSGGGPSLGGAALRVEVPGSDGVMVRLVPQHVVHHDDAELALLYRVPDAVAMTRDGAHVECRVELEHPASWALSGVLGFTAPPLDVRRRWRPGTTMLRADTVDPDATITVRLAKVAA